MPETLLLALTSYIGTNLDDLLLNVLFFSEAQTPSRRRSIIAGKYCGIFVLVLVSVLAAGGLQLLPHRYLSLLGLLPIGLGVRALFTANTENEPAPSHQGRSLWLEVALTTVANGADNLGVYIPLFAGFSPWQLLTVFCVYAAMTALWCWGSIKLTALPPLQRLLQRHRRIVIPVVYLAIGGYILLKGWL